MNKLLLPFILILGLIACQQPPQASQADETPSEPEKRYYNLQASQLNSTDFLLLSSNEDSLNGAPPSYSYVDQMGKTVIPDGKYLSSFTDTFKTFAIVMDSSGALIGIDQRENLLFEVFMFDNGPDYLEEGLFRVMRNGKMGYANAEGEVVIPCRFECAYPFEGGKARVADTCEVTSEGEYNRWESEAWYFIDKSGNRVTE
jgi:hypothetical protein